MLEHNVQNGFRDVKTMDIPMTEAGWRDALDQLRSRDEVRARMRGRGSDDAQGSLAW